MATSLLQYPNPMTREPGDKIIKNLLVDCRSEHDSYVCHQEAQPDRSKYIGWLVYGTLSKLVLTTITFGCKVLALKFGTSKSSLITPRSLAELSFLLLMEAPSLEGLSARLSRLRSPLAYLQWVRIPWFLAWLKAHQYAVGAGAFLAGVCRMTISLVVIMFEVKMSDQSCWAELC